MADLSALRHFINAGELEHFLQGDLDGILDLCPINGRSPIHELICLIHCELVRNRRRHLEKFISKAQLAQVVLAFCRQVLWHRLPPFVILHIQQPCQALLVEDQRSELLVPLDPGSGLDGHSLRRLHNLTNNGQKKNKVKQQKKKIYLSISIYSSIYIYTSLCVLIYLSILICLSIYLSISIPIYLYVYLLLLC